MLKCMRKTLFTFIISMLEVLSSACHHDAITISNRLHKEQTEEERYASRFAGFCVYDSIQFSDGSTAVYKQKSAPMNEDMRMYDRNGRLLASFAAPSEQTGQYLIYDYDKMGRLHRIVEFYANDTKEENVEELRRWCREEDGIFGLDMVKLRNAVEELDFKALSSSFYEVYTLHYDDSGVCKKVTSFFNDTLMAEALYRLDVTVKPCPEFWTNDMHGGYYYIETIQRPIQEHEEYTYRIYDGFNLRLEKKYKDDKCYAACLYHRDLNGVRMTELITLTRTNEYNIYTHFFPITHIKKVEYWKDGRKSKVGAYSRYGTLLESDSYIYSSGQMVSVRHEKINYRTNKLVLEKVEDIPVESHMINECEVLECIENIHRAEMVL